MNQEVTRTYDAASDDYSSEVMRCEPRSIKAATEEQTTENSAIARALALASGIQRRRSSCPSDFSTVNKSSWLTEKDRSSFVPKVVASERPSFVSLYKAAERAETMSLRSRSSSVPRRERMQEKLCSFKQEEREDRQERGFGAQLCSSIRLRRRWLPGKGGPQTNISNREPLVETPISDTPAVSLENTNNTDNEHPPQPSANVHSSLSTDHSFDDCVAAIEELLHISQSHQYNGSSMRRRTRSMENFQVFSRFFARENDDLSSDCQGRRCDTIDKVLNDISEMDERSSSSSNTFSTKAPSVHNGDGILG